MCIQHSFVMIHNKMYEPNLVSTGEVWSVPRDGQWFQLQLSLSPQNYDACPILTELTQLMSVLRSCRDDSVGGLCMVCDVRCWWQDMCWSWVVRWQRSAHQVWAWPGLAAELSAWKQVAAKMAETGTENLCSCFNSTYLCLQVNIFAKEWGVKQQKVKLANFVFMCDSFLSLAVHCLIHPHGISISSFLVLLYCINKRGTS